MFRRKQAGFSFIEVMIAFFVLATGLIGTVAMQAVAKKNSFDATQRAQALAMANDIIERIRANPLAAASYNRASNYGAGDIGLPNPRCQAQASNCTPAQIALNDQYEWDQSLFGAVVTNGANNVGGISGATGCVNFNNGNLTVVVSWLGRESIRDAAQTSGQTNCGSASAERRQVVINTFILQ